MVASASLDRQALDEPGAELNPMAKWGLGALTLAGGVAALGARSIPDALAQAIYGVALAALLLGLTLLAVALGGEALSDWQLRRFKSDPANHGRICETGLWSRSG